MGLKFQPNTGRAALMYTAYELGHAMLQPYRGWVSALDKTVNHPASPFASMPGNRAMQASLRIVDELTKRYAKPEFEIPTVRINAVDVPIAEQVVEKRPFCRLLRFAKVGPSAPTNQPRVLIVTPMSGHFATLLRGTVRAMLPDNDVYITDWLDARSVPMYQGAFDLEDYVDYLRDFIKLLGPELHVLGVCQPSVPALVATALVAQESPKSVPRSLTLMAGPIDVSQNPTAVNDYANAHSIDWFRGNVITYVPFPHMGALRAVYPGFLQLAGFMGMNAESHMEAYRGYFDKLVEGDADSTQQHRRFYDEYLSVMDVTAEYFLQTIDVIFQRRALAQGTYTHRGQRVDCASIRDMVLMTVEGERDDICGLGQTEAAHALCSSLTDEQRYHYVQPGVGHYGVFNGARWRTEIQPRIQEMIRTTSA
ncbi:MAG: poly(3-hydroxybutyrate) depolymerase [Gammaproteobacteria bacterium]|jgi:poly(3-hydroxybutyrate) depolymerase